MNHSKLFFSLLGRILFADICKFGKKACFLNGTIPTARKKANCTHTHTHTLSLSHTHTYSHATLPPKLSKSSF